MSAPLLDRLHARGLAPKLVAATHGGEYASPCPACGGRDRFRVWPEQTGGPACEKAGVRGTWFCRHENRGGDTLEFLVSLEGMSWRDACKALNIAHTSTVGKLPSLPKADRRATFAPVQPEPPATVWRERAAKLADEAHAALLGMPKVLAYLAARGLPEAAVRRYRLGCLAGENGKEGIFRPRAAWGLQPKPATDGKREKRALYIPRGIVIPAYGPQGHPVRLRIRRPDVDVEKWGDKYMVVEGGCGRTTMLLGDAPRVILVVEAELDAMVVHHAAGEFTGALAVLTNRGKPDARSHAALQQAACILVALDYDGPGAEGWDWWRQTYPTARRWPVPAGKDPGDAFKLGEDLRAWVLAGLPPALQPVPAAPAGGSTGETCAGAGGERTAAHTQAATAPRPAAHWPEAVIAFRNRWDTVPAKYVKLRRGGFEWKYDDTWARNNPGKLASLLRAFDDAPELWAWFDAHPDAVITPNNLLRRKK